MDTRKIEAPSKVWAILGLLVLVGAVIFSGGPARSQTALSSPEDMIARAREAYNNKQFHESAKVYDQYLVAYPEGPDRNEAGFFYGHCLYLVRDYQRADEAFARDEIRNRTYADQILYYRGKIAALKRDYDRALVFFDRLLGEHPGSRMAGKARLESAELNMRRADLYLGQGAYTLALRHYQQAKGASPEMQALINYKLGLCYARLGEHGQAISTWGDLSLEEGSESRTAALLARYRLARILEDRENFSEAEVNYQAFLKAASRHLLTPPAREGLARVQARQGKLDEAIAFWKKQGQGKILIELSKSYEAALDHYLHEEYSDARQNLKGVIKRSPDPDLSWSARLWLARAYTGEGRASEVSSAWKDVVSDQERTTDLIRLEYARAMLEIEPGAARSAATSVLENSSGALGEEALYISALALLASDHPKALSVADDYLSQYPDGKYAPELAFLRGEKLLAKGNIEAAERDLDLAMKKHPDPEKRFAAALDLAEIYKLQGRYDSAMQTLAQAEKDAPNVPSPQDKLIRAQAQVSFSKGDYQPGIAIYKEICGDTAKNASCSERDLFQLFWGYYRAGEYEEAEKALVRVSATGEHGAFQAGFWKGMMLLEKDDPEAAFDVLNNLAPDNAIDRGFLGWKIARSQSRGGAAPEALSTLALIQKTATGAGFYTRGAVLGLALESSNFEAYLAGLPDPVQLDREVLSEDALLSSLRSKADSGAKVSELEAINDILQVEATSEKVSEEGTLLVAKAGLHGPGRPQAIAMMDSILAGNPGTAFASEIKLYRGEDALFKKDYRSAIMWLKDIKPDDVSDELRFKLIYLQGQTYKSVRDMDAMRPLFLALVEDYKDREGKAREWLDVGVGLTLAGEFKAARTALELSISRTDDRKILAEATYWRGMAEAGAGYEGRALETFLSVADKYSDQGMWVPTALNMAADIYVEMGDYDRALKMYKRVLSLTKGNKKTSNDVKAEIAKVKKLKRQKSKVLNP